MNQARIEAQIGNYYMLKTTDFDYNLPKKFIAQNPVIPRDNSKLLVFDTAKNKIYHKRFFEIGEFLRKGDTLVVNASKVIPARILFNENTSSREIFLLKKFGENKYQAMVKPGKVFKIGKEFVLDKNVKCVVKEILEDGTRIVEFLLEKTGKGFEKVLEEIGRIPFPPYVNETIATPAQYQTVYARENGSVAAPTAGLHFTPELMSKLKKEDGVTFEEVILHVNRGTFMPVKSDNVEDHEMHSESFVLPENVAKDLNISKKNGQRIIAIGTTSVRVLESCFDLKKGFVPQESETKIFIYPGKYKWKATDALITNFHLPKSTLLMLVSSFLENKGIKDPAKKLLDLYELAKKENYRFYSFGDAMMIF